ncbi:hypothetical protein AALO_G00140620 [Alosa alosa]|uniref:Uncharacterized protein n=1 Tax=Alosa alosa TaxID=278164 RepID=A0AAV6GLX1_9TELE|nr:hypothetical protein AALO_G00140620 [Alosa alosa]
MAKMTRQEYVDAVVQVDAASIPLLGPSAQGPRSQSDPWPFPDPTQGWSGKIRGRAVAIPNWGTVGEDALYGAVVEVHQDLWRQVDRL